MNLNRYFLVLLITSLAGVIGLTVSAHHQVFNRSGSDYMMLSAAAGLIPMVIWTTLIWFSPEKTQNQIDTVYFFGFIITLTTLGCGATFATFGAGDAIDQKDQLASISFQFALGLLATGLGLIARVILTNARLTVSSPDDAIEQYLEKIGRVLGRLEDTVGLFDRLRVDVISKAKEGAAAISREAINHLASELKGPVENLRSSLAGITTELSNLQSSEALRTVNTQLRKTAKSLEEIVEVLPPFNENMKSAAETLDRSAKSNEKFAGALQNSTVSMTQFASASGTLGQQVQALSADMGVIGSTTKKLVAELESINAADISAMLNELAKSLTTLVAGVATTNAGFASMSSKLQEAASLISESAAAATVSISTITKSHAELAEAIALDVKNLSAGMGSLTGYVQGLRDKIGQFIDQSEGLDVRKVITAITESIEAMNPLTASARASMESIQGLTASIVAAERKLLPTSTAAAVQLSTLAGGLNESATRLGTAMQQLAGSVRSAAETLGGR